MTNKEKREYAYILYTREGLDQKEIAKRVHVSEKTIGTWKKEDRWERLGASLIMTREAQLSMLYNQLNELNISIQQRGSKHASVMEADVIIKLSAAIKNMQVETGISELVGVAKDVIDFIRKTDAEKAQEFANWVDALIKDKLSKGK